MILRDLDVKVNLKPSWNTCVRSVNLEQCRRCIFFELEPRKMSSFTKDIKQSYVELCVRVMCVSQEELCVLR